MKKITSVLSGMFRRTAMVGAVLLAVPLLVSTVRADESKAPAEKPASQDPTLYVVGYAHLDTQWRWSYPQVIAEFLRHTMEDNFKLFEKYPHFVFNFTGSNRYAMMKEYFPEDFEILRGYVKSGHWFPAGSSVEEGDVNMPNGEAIIRQILYGNQFFHREFGTQSDEYMLPDCFGFQASLPSLLAHCGLKGFSTQKLTWGSAVGVPFNVGVWEGPDGKGVVAALNCGPYDASVDSDLSQDKKWVDRVDADGKKTGVYVDYRYYGVGDRGGAPREKSVEWVEKSVTDSGPLKVIGGASDLMFKSLTPAQIAALPRYKGDLLLTNHSCGSLSSQAFVKRTNRKLEELSDAAERASVIADWIGSAPYPRQKLWNAWMLQLGAHFHDTMAGTALPKAYEYTWNNMVLALNQFAAVALDGVGGVAQGMDTRTDGIPIIVYNPLSVDRQDVAAATLTNAPAAFSVDGPDGNTVPFQIVSKEDAQTKIIFLAHVPSVSFSVFTVNSSNAEATQNTALKATDRQLENERFRVALNDAGDIASVFDKRNNKEILAAPARLEFLYQNPKQYPAWNMDWEDRSRAPAGYVEGPCTFRVLENGPVRVTLETSRTSRGSTITQQISLSAGEAGDKVEVVNHVDWQTRESSLEATFPLTVSNPNATYESQSAAVSRGTNTTVKFEVPQQQWLDLTATDGSYGAAILNDCKYGSDKPDDSTIRLTLLYTPGTRAGYQDQGTQDLGRHEFTYAIAPHAGTWQAAQIPWSGQRLNQPVLTFNSAQHEGSLGKSMSMASVDRPNVSISAMKKAEESDEIIIRLHETNGVVADPTTVSFLEPIQSAREVDGQERAMGPAKIVEGKLVTQMFPFGLRAFAIKLAQPTKPISPPVSQAINLAYDLDAVSTHGNLTDGSFDAAGHTFAAEALPTKIDSEGIQFTLGPTADGRNNALTCRGQTLPLPAGSDKVYLLAVAVDGDAPAVFKINDIAIHKTIQDWSGNIGQWDNRIWQGVVPELTYNFANKFVGLVPGFVKQDTVAWFCSHRHDPSKGNEYYKFSYLFKYGFDVTPGASTITLPDNDKIRVFAMTAVQSSHDNLLPARPLYDTLKDHQYQSLMISPQAGVFNHAVYCSMDRALYGRLNEIHLTLDGSEPTAESPVYTRPIALVSTTTVQAGRFQNGKLGGSIATEKYEINDTTPPAIVSATSFAGLPHVSVTFSEPVQKESAQLASNYKIDPSVDVVAAQLADDGVTVSLTLAQPLPDKIKTQITVSGVRDISPAGNRILPAPTQLSITSPVVNVDAFIADGTNGKEFKVDGLSGQAQSPWTMNFFLHTDESPQETNLIAGFGTNQDKKVADGSGRFIGHFGEGIHFWSRGQDVTGTSFDVGSWQMITAAYDGTTLSLYKNGRQINAQPIDLNDDEPIVRLAPTDPWKHNVRFKGQIRNFTIWSESLRPDQIKAMLANLPK